MLDTYRIFDTVEAWQLEVGDPATIEGETNTHIVITDVLEDSDDVVVVGLSQETGEKETYRLVWDKPIDLWRVDDE